MHFDSNSISLENPEEFIKAVLMVVSFDPRKIHYTNMSVVSFECADDEYYFNEFDKLLTQEIVFNIYSSRLGGKYKNIAQTYKLLKDSFCLHFLTARERIDAKLWIKETLKKHKIFSFKKIEE